MSASNSTSTSPVVSKRKAFSQKAIIDPTEKVTVIEYTAKELFEDHDATPGTYLHTGVTKRGGLVTPQPIIHNVTPFPKIV